MSPDDLHKTHSKVGVPRASGDEPFTLEVTKDSGVCSPRERG